MKYFLSLLSFTLLIISCEQNNSKAIDTSNVNIELDFVDFHNLYFNSDKNSLQDLKQKYPFLFPTNVNDSIWIAKKENPEEILLYKMVDSVFGNLSSEKTKLLSLYKNLKYYSPSFEAPKTFSIITNLDYNNNIVYADSLLFISIDMYLGNNSEVYNSFPKYLSQQYTKDHLFVDIANSISKQRFKIPNGSTFLENIIHKGKELYLLECLLPNTSELILSGYSKEKLNWAKNNESNIWSYFIENELFFSNDKKLSNRFINPAPFSKFYLEYDRNSPGQIGVWIGWKIVSAYAKTTKTELLDILKTDSETIFRKSKYKPKK
jgi:gliding motility-associated lipoprotein GldB